MSWSYETYGKPEDVQAEVLSDNYVPDNVKEIVKDVCVSVKSANDAAALADTLNYANGVRFSGSGHSGGGCPSSARIECAAIHLAPAAPPNLTPNLPGVDVVTKS
jgi:hypothetical protein